MKHKLTLVQTALLLTGLAAVPAFAAPFVSGSTGADGAFAPTTNTTVQLPPSGVLHYTTVNIPAGVTVKFAKNSANTAVVMLTTGDVTIAGAIDISGGASLTTKYGLAADMNRGGVGGPGGFDGGRGGLQQQNRKGGTGYGPGGAGGGIQSSDANQSGCYAQVQGGGGGGFAAYGEGSRCIGNNGWIFAENLRTGYAGVPYGANSMLPLVGGSGGGGGGGGPNGYSLPGAGGGAGGGALMIVASGSVALSGTINARGGNGGVINNGDCYSGYSDSGGAGGGGSGGAVRILTPTFSGSGSIIVGGGTGGCRPGNGTSNVDSYNAGGHGGAGRSSVEIVAGGTFNLSAIPTLAITSIGGVAVPPNPSGAGDVSLPGELPNPATIEIAASGIPIGTVVKQTLSQPYGDKVTANASALAGTLQASTSTGSVNIPSGSSVLMASTTYALSVAQGEALKVYAKGERVEKVNLAAVMGGEMRVTLITVSGKEFEVPAAVLAAAQVDLG